MRNEGSTPASLRSTLHILVDPGSPPSVAMHTETLWGREVVFATIQTEHRTSAFSCSTAVSFSGEPVEVLALLKRCTAALDDLIGTEGGEAE
jgi:hypothetical protein